MDIPESEDETGLMIITANNCRDDATLVVYAILHGGHNWPGIASGIPSEVAGQINLDVDATQVIWDFLQNIHLNNNFVAIVVSFHQFHYT